MTFEEYRDSTVNEFKYYCKRTGAMKENLTDEQIDLIKERFEEHKECYKHKDVFDSEDSEMFGSVIYGDGVNIAIECFQCDSVIIDSDVLKGDE